MRWLGEQEICIVVSYSKNVCSSLMCLFLSQGTMTTHFTNPREENGVSVRPAAQDQCNSLINFLDFIFTFLFFFILCYFLLFINYQTKILLSKFPLIRINVNWCTSLGLLLVSRARSMYSKKPPHGEY